MSGFLFSIEPKGKSYSSTMKLNRAGFESVVKMKSSIMAVLVRIIMEPFCYYNVKISSSILDGKSAGRGRADMTGDIEVVKRCQSKDPDAFEELFRRYEKKIYNLCYYTLKNKEDALDTSQEVCLKIYKSIKKFKGESKLSTWIYRIAYNTCLDHIKKRKDEVSFDESILVTGKGEGQTESIFEAKELKHDLTRCILKLSEEFRTIIILRDISGMSYQEIAEILNLQVGTVKSRLSRAREALKSELIKNGYMGR